MISYNTEKEIIASDKKDTYSPVPSMTNTDVPEYTLRQRNKKKNVQSGIKDHFCDYCSTTGLHGFPYLGQSRTYVEIAFWIILLILSFAASVYMINEIYQKYLASPIIISIASKRTQIHEIPFPAITICPNTRFDKECFDYNVIKMKLSQNESLAPNEAKNYDYANYLCSDIEESFVQGGENYFNEDIFSFLDKCKAAQIYYCNHANENCTDKWVPILTESGVCYTYNMIDRHEVFQPSVIHNMDFLKVPYESKWDPETGKYTTHNVLDEVYPNRSLFTGLDNALQVAMIEPKQVFKYKCDSEVEGYKVMLHLPVRYPLPSEDFFYLPLGKTLMGTVKPSMIVTQPVIKSYDPSKRLCYFPSEKKLEYFKIYTQANCLKDCLTYVTQDQCKCVDFHMPRTNGTPICGPNKQNCSQEAKENKKMFRMLSVLMSGEELTDGGDEQIDLSSEMQDDKFPTNSKNTSEEAMKWLEYLSRCDCLPECNEITYKVDASSYELQSQSFLFRHSLTPSLYETHHISLLNLYYTSRYVTTLERNELYGISDFISNFGGLIGLFTGFSILSAVEILYFLSLRIWGNIKLYGYWAVPSAPESKDT